MSFPIDHLLKQIHCTASTLVASKLIMKVAAHNFLTPLVPQLINAPLGINRCCCQKIL